MSVVSGTSFSAPTFTGICANYVIDQFGATRNGKSIKEAVYEHLDEAIKPVYKGDGFWGKLKKTLLRQAIYVL